MLLPAWLLLLTAIVLEVAGTTSMKLSQGFTRVWPSVMIFVCYGLAFLALTLALKRLDLSVAYAIWAGAGTALVALVGMVLFHEPFGWLRAVSLALVVAGVIGLTVDSQG